VELEIYDAAGYLLGSLDLEGTTWTAYNPNHFLNRNPVHVPIKRSGTASLQRLKLGNQSLESRIDRPFQVDPGESVHHAAGRLSVSVLEPEQVRPPPSSTSDDVWGDDSDRVHSALGLKPKPKSKSESKSSSSSVTSLRASAECLRALFLKKSSEDTQVEAAARDLLNAVYTFLGTVSP
jgi:hypothetical protein